MIRIQIQDTNELKGIFFSFQIYVSSLEKSTIKFNRPSNTHIANITRLSIYFMIFYMTVWMIHSRYINSEVTNMYVLKLCPMLVFLFTFEA